MSRRTCDILLQMILTCTVCKKEFKRKPFQVRKSGGKYCSNACHYAGVRTGKVLECATCSKEIYRQPKRLRLSKYKKFFCCKSCQTIWRNQIFFGANHKSWKGGASSSAYRRILKKEARDVLCEVCKTSDVRLLAVHHKDRNRSNNKPENLAWLCHNCHFLVHHYDVGRDLGLLKPRS